MTTARHTLFVFATLLVAALLGAACTNQARTPTPTPSAAASPTTAAGAPCAASDLTASAGGWSAAAGSRGADVLVENAGPSPCVLEAAPSVAIVDDAASVLLEGVPEAATGEGPTLDPGATASFTVLASNWCDQPVGLPYHLVLRADGGAVQVSGLDLATIDDLPPCNGPGQPATLSANAWVLP
jgi:hypothetical protein